jgi:hypothetical protein
MGKLIHLAPLAVLGCLALASRLPAAGPPAAVPPAPTTEPSKFGPSRHAGDDLKAYVDGLAKQFSSGARATDPFGQPQDPEAKLVAKPTTTDKIKRRVAPVAPTALSEIVSQIPITMVKPKTKSFSVDGREFHVGDKLPINFRNTQIQTEITEVSASRVVFRNIDTKEIGIHTFARLPEGITRGGKKAPAVPPGMTPANRNAPLEIDTPTSSPASPTNP